jgi:hypothetical protein
MTTKNIFKKNIKEDTMKKIDEEKLAKALEESKKALEEIEELKKQYPHLFTAPKPRIKWCGSVKNKRRK